MLAQYTTENVADLRSEVGDIGLVTEHVLLDQKGKKLDVLAVYEALWKVINVKGTGSVNLKATYVADILAKLSAKEAKFFTRMVAGKLRIGVSVKTFVDALSVWVAGDKSLSESINLAYGCDADLGYIAQKVYVNKTNIDKFVTALEVIPGIPLLAKLVERVDSFEDGFDRFGGKFMLQPKYDGLRCQIHKYTFGGMLFDKRNWYRYLDAGSSNFGLFDSKENQIVVKLFSRNLEDLTEMFPEIVESARALPCNNVILDGEIIGWQERKEAFLSYQDTMTRKRKFAVQAAQESVPVRAFVFDIMFLNNESLLRKSLEQRIKILSKLNLKKSKDIMLSPMGVVDNLTDMQAQFDMYVAKGLEGVVIKGLDTVYSPGVRNYDWIKIKKSISESLVDTLDLVVLGYYKGSGKRSGFGIGAILAGIYNEKEDRFESFTKVGTGITDDMFKKIFERLQPIILKEKPKNVEVEDILKPDVWVYPEVVMTVKADEISKSRNDTKIAKGFSLRFPRLIEWDRDKSVYDVFRVEDL
jgi:DNA ligase 1